MLKSFCKKKSTKGEIKEEISKNMLLTFAFESDFLMNHLTSVNDSFTNLWFIAIATLFYDAFAFF